MSLANNNSSTGEISVRLYATLAGFAGGKTGCFTVVVSASETLIDVIQRLGIPTSEVSLAFVNGSMAPVLNMPIKFGDEIELLGIVDGG